MLSHVHEAFGGHQATCIQIFKWYDSLTICYPQFSNQNTLAFRDDQIIWHNTLHWNQIN